MNREIKFRGYSSEQKKWIYGSLYNGLEWADFIIENIGFEHRVRVIPESIGQYTGLKDKNGKEIYEGDIVTGWSFAKEVVEYDKYYARFKPIWIQYWINEYLGKKIKIIGNIFENPELLK